LINLCLVSLRLVSRCLIIWRLFGRRLSGSLMPVSASPEATRCWARRSTV